MKLVFNTCKALDLHACTILLAFLQRISMKTYQEYESCIELCLKCASICDYCASACTKEKDVNMMVECIRLDMECAALCYATAQVMSMNGQTVKDMCRLCAEICEGCGAECAKHHHGHCRQCADICRQCAEECRKMAV